ncbi:HPr-rel-A system PqqD family peptide chaperone [Rubrivivax gelatinosus]|uniref:PqqD family protein of HPr-rel-A system n=1 Tax=Rubrivivax gelatinosus TaxID=28068 RepID=A0ABS1E049_RUBGE|nr:hypothetical protein [Rubrivivax gelatinosus]
MLWSFASRPAAHLRTWDDDASGIGYDERSGDTFVLGALALELIVMLQERGPLAAAAIVEDLALRLGTVQPSLAVDVDAELGHLAARGFVESLPT